MTARYRKSSVKQCKSCVNHRKRHQKLFSFQYFCTMNLLQLKIASFSFICFWLLTATVNAQYIYNEKHVEVSLRTIGHQILLNAGDSTSLVLPVIKNKHQYKIQFENEFEFVPDELYTTVNEIVKETKIAFQYIVEVEKCLSKEIAYSYEVEDLYNIENLPCTSRALPKSCYSIIFTLIEQGEVKTGLHTATINPSDGLNLTVYIALLILLTLIGIGFFFIWKNKNKTVDNPNLISIGQFQFDKINSNLILENEVIELSGKEADLLLLLYNSVNTTIEKQVILNKVWKDEGDYVGRTLDVFISKLRKKLKPDDTVKIVNIRGVGYKLVVDSE